MKIIRVIFIILGLLLVISQAYFIILIIVDPKVTANNGYNLLDNLFAPVLFFVIGALFLFFAYRINRMIRKKKDIDLIKSLPE